MEKEKEEKEKEMKKKKKKKRKRINIATLCLETRARSEGYMAKVFKARCPKPSLVGRCSLHGWIGGVEQVVGAGVSKSFEVRGEI